MSKIPATENRRAPAPGRTGRRDARLGAEVRPCESPTMAVTPSFRLFVEDQLGQIVPVRSRAMFGGVGLYADDAFFALIADDVLYLKVDDDSRADFEALGSEPFRPFGDDRAMSYYSVPADLLEDTARLRPWVLTATEVAHGRRGEGRGRSE